MNKIFKIPNGELLDVPLEQEQDFLKQANAFNTQVELVLDNSTNFDMVPPKQDLKIEDTSTTTPPKIKNYSLGEGVDFALMSPNEILTMENASDYFNLRSQAILFNNNSDGNQLEKLNNDLSKMKPDNELSDEQLSYKKKQQDLYDLYNQNSGYLDFNIYGNMKTWGPEAHARNKEVKDAIFSGEYGYNPKSDKLYKLDKKIKVDVLPTAYQQISGFETYYDYVNTVNTKQNQQKILAELDSLKDSFKIVTDYDTTDYYTVEINPDTGEEEKVYSRTLIKEDDYEYTNLSDMFKYDENNFVDYLGATLFDYGFNMEQTGEYSGDSQVRFLAYNGKEIVLDVNISSKSKRDKQAEILLKFLKENANPEGGYMQRGEIFNEAIQPTKDVLDNWSLDFKQTKDFIDKMRIAFELEGQSDYYVMNFYTRYRRYRDFEGEFLFYEPGGDHHTDRKRNDAFGDLDLDFTESEIRNFTQRLLEQGIDVANLPEPSNLEKTGTHIDFEFIALEGQRFDVNQALRYYIDVVREVEIDGKMITVNRSNYQLYEEAIKRTEKFKKIYNSLQQSPQHVTARDAHVKDTIRLQKTYNYMQKKGAEIIEYMGADLFGKEELQVATLQDVQYDISNISEEISKLNLTVASKAELLTELQQKQELLFKEMAEMGTPAYFAETLRKKYDLKAEGGLSDYIYNEEAQKELIEHTEKYSRLRNEYILLTEETIPLVDNELDMLYQNIDTSNYTFEEFKMMQKLLARNFAPGSYYTYQVAKGIYNTVYGGITAFGASLTDAYIEIADLIGDPKDAPFIDFITATNKQFTKWNKQVKQNIGLKDQLFAPDIAFGDIETAGDALQYLFTGAINNATILAVAIIAKNPRVAGALLGTYSGSEKYNELRIRRDLFRSTNGAFGQDFTVLQLLSNALITGTLEAVSEKFTLGQWKRMGYFTKKNKTAALTGFKNELRKNVWTDRKFDSFLLYYGGEITSGGLEEVLADFSSNAMDVLTGVEGASFFDGIDESFINGAFLSTLMTSPAMFKQGAIDPFLSKDTNQRIAEKALKVEKIISKESAKRFNGKKYEDLSPSERSVIDELVMDEVMAIEKMFEEELFKVDLLSKDQKRELLEIHKNDYAARKKINEIANDPKLSQKEKFEQIAELDKGRANNEKRKFEILNTVDKDAAKKLYEQKMDDVAEGIKKTMELTNGDTKTTLTEFDTQEFAVVEKGGITKEDLTKREENINKNNAKIKENIIQIDSIRNQKIKPLEGKSKFDMDAEIQRLKNENAKLEKQNRSDEKIIETFNVAKDDVIGEDLLKDKFYGVMRPIYDGKTGNLKEIKIVINKKKAIEDGMWATAAHEFTHALFAHSIKGDTAMRIRVGDAMTEILTSKNINFKTDQHRQLFNYRIDQYDSDKQGEEMLAVAAEMMIKGEITIKDSVLTRIGDIFRRWSMSTFGINYKFNNANDIKNFLKDYSYSIKNNKPSKSIANLLLKGAKGKMFKDARTPAERKNMEQYSVTASEWMRQNINIVNKYDKHTRNEDGSKKYKNKKEWERKGQADNVAVWQYIRESGKGSLDSRILEEQGGFDPKGLPMQVQQDYIRKVKDNLQERWLKNFDPSKNESAAGYLFGKNGVLYHAKKDVQKDYVEKEGGTDKRSIDRQTSDGQSYADVIAAEKDDVIDRIENADLSKQEAKELKNTVDDLIMVTEMLDLPNNVKTAIKQTIAAASIPLDGLTYKGVRDLLISIEGKATTEKKVVPTGVLFEVLNNISAEFGIDPLRILAKQDLNAEQRKAAQEYILAKSVNENGSFNPRFLDALPEGQDRDGRATGVANTKLGQFYAKGKRLKVGEGAKKKLGQKFAQNKRKDITKEEFLNLFGINVDGTFQPGTKADGAIRELVVQMSQLAANQEMRLNAIENRLESANVIAKLKDGVSEAMYSKVLDQDIAGELEKLKKQPKETLDREGFFYEEGPTKKYPEGRDKGFDKDDKQTIKLFDPTAISKYAGYTVKDKKGKIIGPTQQQHLNRTIAKFLLKFPQHFETIINTVTGSIDRSLYGTKENFIKEIIKDLPKKDKAKLLKIARQNYKTDSDKRPPDFVEQKYKRRNSYTTKKKQTKDTIKNIKEDLKNDRAEYILDYYKDVETYLIDNPNDFVIFNEIRRDNNSNQSGGYGRTQINALFYIKEKNSDKADEKIIVVEEHSSPQADVNTEMLNAARKGILDKLRPIFKAKLVQGSIADNVDKIVNNSYKFKQAPDFNEIIAQKILKGKLTVKDSRLTSLIRYIVPQKTKDGKPYYVDINNMVWAPTGKTWAQEFGVDITDKSIEITQSVIEAQNKLAREVIIGNITPQQAKDKLNDIPLKSLSELDIQRPTKITRNKLVALVNSIIYSKPIEVKGMSTFDFDDTLARTSSGVLYTMPDGTTGRLTAEEFARDGDTLLEDGAKFDFSEFNDVVDGKPGPLLQKARNRAKKFGTKDMFVLTARPQASAKAIQQFLKSQGLDIPLENITGLGDSTGDAKAQWMLDKVDKGYNDMYFVDDAFQNVEAVKVVLDQLDIKSNVVQAKLKENGKSVEVGNDNMYSKVVKDDATGETKDINTEFNDIIERKKKIDSRKRFSSAEARKRGAKIGKFRFYIPPSAEDFKGLIYYFLGRGKQGDADMRFFEKTLFKPFATGIRAWNTYKQNMVNEYKALQKQFPKVKRTKKVPGTSFTVDTAIRVYLWDKAGFEIPGISKTLQKKLVAYVNQNANVKGFAEGLSVLSRRGEGYIEPSNNWMMETIAFDLRDIVERVGRQEFLAEFMENRDIIFSPENLNKIEAAYGTSFRNALENILFRMENGTNRTFGQDKVTNRFTEWINGSVGAIMFFNTRSSLLQTMSTVNFINWSDNNIFKASAAFANQPRFWKDFVMIFNSPQLKQRRKGLQTDVSASELTQTFKDNGYSPRTVINYLLQKGFLPTQIADSFAIAFGGASFYRNRYNKYIKQGMSAKKANEQAMLDMQEIAEQTQQSSREDLISQQQAGPLGRIILAFQNVTMQYGRLTKKALLDIVNNRGDMKTNVSKLIYYGAVQNVVFLSLQSALAFALFGDDDELIEDKTARLGNGVLDSFLRGTGLYGAIISTIKNTVIQWDAQSKKGYGQQDTGKIALELVNLSPPIGSKIRKIISAFKTEQYNKGVSDELGLRVENPTIKKWASIIEAATNVPLARLLNKANNIEEAITGQHATLERVAMLLGWNAWELGVEDEELEEAKDAAAEKRAEQKKKEKEQEKKEKEKAKEEEKKKEEQEKKEKGIKTVRCSGIRSNGERCNITTETAEEKFLCVHHMEFKDGMDRDGDGIKEYRCTAIKANGKRCNNKTENKNKKCYAHQ